MRRAILPTLLGLFLFASSAPACELCRDSTAAPTQAGAAPPSASFNASICWMLGSIAAVGGFAGTALYRTARQAESEND